MFRSTLAAILVVAGYSGNVVAQSAESQSLPDLVSAETPPPIVDFVSATNFDELRLAYAKRADFAERCELNRPTTPFMAHVNAKDFLGAVQIAEEWLASCPVDAKVHLWSAAAYLDAGNHEKADVHKRWFDGLTDSALRSGDGKTAKSPIVTISIGEEYAVLMRLRLEADGQALLEGPPMLDLVRAKDQQGNKRVLYFNPEWHFIRLAHRIQDKKP